MTHSEIAKILRSSRITPTYGIDIEPGRLEITASRINPEPENGIDEGWEWGWYDAVLHIRLSDDLELPVKIRDMPDHVRRQFEETYTSAVYEWLDSDR